MDNSDKKHEQTQESELLRLLKDKGDPFVAPEGFFQEQFGQIMGQIEDEELEVSPSFGERQNEVFQAPEGYFEQFPQRLMQQLPKQEAKTVSMRQYLFPAAIAAAIAILIAFGWAGIKLEPTDQFLTEGMADFSATEMLAILDQENIEAELLLELMPEGSFLGPQSLIDEPLDNDLEALFDELDDSDLESLLLE
ncbi:MAG: hypothetical protein AB8H47_07745 [Bacteroidia bacterium]